MASEAKAPYISRTPDETVERKSVHDQIAALAYALWQQRGCPNGTPEQDWYDAEQKLRATPGTSLSALGATEDQMNMRGTVPPRVDKRGTKVEEMAGTGEQDSRGG